MSGFEDLQGEEWRPAPGWEGLYEVSNMGRVCALPRKRILQRRLLKPHVSRRILRTTVGLTRAGSCRKNRQKVTVSLPRLVLKAFVGDPPPGHECCHNDGDMANNALSNLRWDTHAANVADKRRHGTNRRNFCLSADQEKHLFRLLWSREHSYKELALRFGISPNTVSSLATGKRKPQPSVLAWWESQQGEVSGG